MALRADAGKQERWLDLVERWQRSKLTVREFCRRQQISEPNFYSWRRMLRERGLIHDPPEPTTPAFVKLTLDAVATTPGVIDVIVGQRVLRVTRGFDAKLLLELVRLFEEHAC
jgi:transposase-like protein